jgi:hypothetical protein
VLGGGLLFALAAIALLFSEVAQDELANLDQALEDNTKFLRKLRIETAALPSHAKDDALRSRLEKLAEAVRFSDPISSAATAAAEAQIATSIAALKTLLVAPATPATDANTELDKIVTQLADRNARAKLSKNTK